MKHLKFGESLVDYSYFSLYTSEGAPGVDRLHVLDATYLIEVWWRLGLGVEYFYYYRNVRSDTNPDIRKEKKGSRVLVAYVSELRTIIESYYYEKIYEMKN